MHSVFLENAPSTGMNSLHERPGVALHLVTLEQAVRECTRRLMQAGIKTAALDARLIVAHAVDKSSEELVRDGRDVLTASQNETVRSFLARRLAREPLAYVTEQKEFWSLEFAVTCDTLIPRPDSETLVTKALELLTPFGQKACTDQAFSILDLGTGTGCLLLSLLSELDEARGIGVDNNRGALEVARSNALRHGLAERAGFIESDWGANIPGRFNLVITNPPYICSQDLEHLAPEVCQFEPRGALDGGDDGLEAYRQISRQVGQLLLQGGYIIVEIGSDQAEDVKEILFDLTPLKFIELSHDLGGRPRCLIGQYLG